MNLFKKLFGGKASKSPSVMPASTPATSTDNDANLIRAFDAYGREIHISRQQWRDNILLGNVKKHWNDADKLAGLIIQALQDKFHTEMLGPAERLLQLEANAERSSVLLAIVYLKVGRLDDSERVLRGYMSRNGETGTVLTNLAKVFAERGDDVQTMATLWHALELDPNQDNGLGWFEVLHREKGGDQASLEALSQIAKLPGSWRAQLWLARSDLRAQRLDQALSLYRQSLACAGKPAPVDLLMQMSGDLGNAGYLAEILALAEPEFTPALHGLLVGNNLIKANLDLGRIEDAHGIVEKLYALKRPDWRENLSYWDTEISKARLASVSPIAEDKIQIEILNGTGPVWLKADTPTAALFPAKEKGGRVVSFLGSTARRLDQPDHVKQQLADAPGRLSRALPIFLTEQTEFLTNANTQILIPWVPAPHSGFVLGGMIWEDQYAVELTQKCEIKSDFIVITHVLAEPEEWTVQLRLIRTADSHCVGEMSEAFPMATPTLAILQLSRKLLALLDEQPGIDPQPCPTNYTLPEGQQFAVYLLRLEQMLAVSCSSIGGESSMALSGERDILDGSLQQCLDMPSSVNVRIIFAKTLLYMKDVRPDILPEYAERVALLQSEHAIVEPAHGLVQQLFDQAFAV